MDAKLVIAKGKTTIKEIPLAGLNTIIGRKNDCDLQIPSPLVSRQHCELTYTGSKLIVKDLGSSNGTFVNGSKVKQKELKSGDTLGVGPVTFIVQLDGEPISPSDTARPRSKTQADVPVGADDAADFVVGEDAPAGGAEDFVVAVQSADVHEIADFAVGEQDPTEVQADFVVAEAVQEGETIHDVNMADMVDADTEAEPLAGEGVAEAEVTTDSEPEAEPEPPKKKPGLFGRLFKKKAKAPKGQAPAAEAPAKKKKATSAVPSKTPPPTSTAAESAAPEFVVADEAAHADTAHAAGEDDMADFLMKLNENDQ